jgi:hypothetical protein
MGKIFIPDKMLVPFVETGVIKRGKRPAGRVNCLYPVIFMAVTA